MNADLNKIILSAEEISARIQEIAEDINGHYQDKVNEMTLITLLDGAIVFTADLIRHLSVPLRLTVLFPVTETQQIRRQLRVFLDH